MTFVVKRNFSGKATQHHESMLNYLKNFLPLLAVDFDKSGPIISVKPENLLFVLKSLKLHTNTQYNLLTAVSGVDYPFRKRRFEVVYDFLSVKFNSRIRVKTFVDEVTPLVSAASVFPASTWWEREVWDLYGVFFEDNEEIKRILTDYGFEGHPLRKDFPLSGYVESRYDDNLKRVVCEPLEHAQEFRSFDFTSGWSSHLIK
jgi:NADH dehydrogenase (ubiquinone) Fe-S protein 3